MMSWDNVEEDVKKGPLGAFKWLVIAVICLTVVFGGMGLLMKPAHVAVERIVFENSFQYSEARSTEIATFEAQLAEIKVQLTNPNLEADTRINLEAQVSAIRVQLKVARSKQKK